MTSTLIEMEIDMARNLQQEIADRIIAAMEGGKLPWNKPWSGSVGGGMPKNAITGRAYSGANVILLWMTAEERGYTSPKWLTYKQAAEAGGTVRKGEKGTTVVYVSTFQKEGDDGKVASVPFLKAFTVFNVEQCDGLTIEAPAVYQNNEERDALCDAFIATTKADIRHSGARAFYNHAGDFIQLPAWEAFNGREGYYATALHELVHWTGAKARCDREFGKRFGDQAYAVEELVAELGAAFMCAEFGYDCIDQSAAYIQNWIALLKTDPRVFTMAASKASRAVEFLRGLAVAEDEMAEAA